MEGIARGHQRADTLKRQSQTTDQSDHMDHRLVKLNETKPCHVGAPKTDGSWWRGLIECGPLEKGLANHFSILTLRTPWTGWEGKKIGHWKMISPGQLLLLLLLLSCFSHVWLCATPYTAAHHAPPSLGFSRQEHWSGLPFHSPKLKSESEVTQSCPILCDPMIAAYQAPLSMGFSRQEYWSGVQFPSLPQAGRCPICYWR